MKKLFSVILSLLIVFSLTTAVFAVEYVDRTGWSVTASSERKSEYLTADHVIDGDTNTYWHTDYVSNTNKDEAPFYLTFYLPKKTTISGFSYLPRQGNVTGAATKYKIYASGAVSGNAELIYSGTLKADTDEKKVSFGYNVEVRTIVFEITEGEYGYGTCAEFNLLAADGLSAKTVAQVGQGETVAIEYMAEYVDRTGWSVTASSTRVQDNLFPELMIDGKTNTYWHTNYNDTTQDKAPFYLTFYLPKKTTISGFSYLPRQDNDNDTGTVTAYNIYASDSDSGEDVLVHTGTMADDKSAKRVPFGFTVDVKKVVFEITAGKWGYGTCAEFNLVGDDGSIKKSLTQIEQGIGDGAKIQDKSRWSIKASSQKSYYPAAYAIDGNTGSYWHSDYTDDGTNILTQEVNPHWIEVTLPERTVISGFSYTPRSENAVGRIYDYEFYVSDSDNGELKLINSGTFEDNASVKEVRFPANVEIKKFKFRSLTSANNFGVVAELDIFVGSSEITTAANIDEFIKICEEEKLIAIPSKEITATATSEWGTNTAMMAVDGISQTAWHSSIYNWNTAGYFPVILNVDLGASYKIYEIAYYPRKDDTTMNGIWLDFDIWAGDNEQSLKCIKEKAALDLTLNTQTIAFDKPVEARYFKFVINDGHTRYATCAELLFYEKATDANAREENKTKYTLQIGSNEIKIEENGVERTETMDVAPYIDKGYTMIPLRGLLEQMGATVDWDDKIHRITIKADGVTITMHTFKKLVTVTDKIYGEVRYTLRTVPWVKDSRTFVPLRFISENLGYSVTWNGDTQEIIIVK